MDNSLISKIIKYFRKYGWCWYLGLALSFLGYGVLTYQFWIFALPLSILIAISKYD